MREVEADRPTVITDVEVAGERVDVRLEGGWIAAVERDLDRAGAAVVPGAGGALLPGLHDHHLHLLAMAAARRSVDLSKVADAARFDRTLRAAHAAAPPGRWLRVVGLADRHGPIDRHRLDRLAPGRPVRIQHRSGAAWVLSSAGLAAIGDPPEGDGWLHRHDAELGRRWHDPDAEATDLAAVGGELARWGITGVTDATPSDDAGAWQALADARSSGAVRQRVVAMGGPALAGADPPADLALGPVKLVVTDHQLPTVAELVAGFDAARHAGRPVAVHCVTRVGLVLALTAWGEVGANPGDRIEHGAVIPAELVAAIAELGVAVVTQPGFLRERGDTYLDEVDPDDLDHLYRCGSLLSAGIGVGLSSDAPFGPADPWLAIAAAADRRTASGRVVGPAEAIAPARALAALLSAPTDPGGAARRVEVGAPADLCLLDRPLALALRDPGGDRVRATWIAGQQVHGDEVR